MTTPDIVQPIQTSFAAGELSPRLYSRLDLEVRRHACKSVVNFMPRAHGVLDFIRGFKYRCTISGSYGRLIPFDMRTSESYVIVVTTSEIIVVSSDDSESNITLSSPYSTDEEIASLHYAFPPGEDSVILACETVALQYVKNVSGSWSTGTVSLSNAPSEWTGTTQPGTVAFFGGRMWCGKVSGYEERIYASKSGDFYNFDTGTALDDEAIIQDVDKRGAIKWYAAGRDLVLGTENGIHRITATTVITPSDIQIELHSSEGTSDVQAVLIGNRVIYASTDNRKLLEFKYSFDEQGWISKDLTFTAEHITDDNTIVTLSKAINPDRIVYMNTSQSNILACSRNIHPTIIGWSNIEFDNTDIVAQTTLSYNGNSNLWVLVLRDSTLTLEVQGTEYLNSYDTQTLSSEGTSIGSFPHLANQTVQVLVDGGIHPDVTLDSSGNGELTYAGTEIVVGYGYEGEIELLNMAVQKTTTSLDTTFMSMKHWAKVFVYLVESAALKINGVRPPSRQSSTNMGEVESLSTQFWKVSTRGIDRDGSLSLTQDIPFKTTVAAICGELIQS